MKCIAIDDEPLALRQISGYISKIPFLELVSTFRSAVAAQEWLKENSTDLIFVDINMPDMTGVEFVQSLETPTMVIFTTAYAEYAIEGYKLSAIDYLLKPFGLQDITRASEKALSLHELLQLQGQLQRDNEQQSEGEDATETTDDKEVLSVHADRKTHLVKVSNIVYLESAGEYVRLHLADGTKLVTLFRLKNMESTLQSSQFMRVHRSYIVNLSYVSGYTKGRIYLSNDDYVPIGESYKEMFLNYINEVQ
ncbi:MAG: response regulator transcription factor [Rikenellaceae bacterium]|nr:response regulator transcription factor [Rikenellaceae bacterium]